MGNNKDSDDNESEEGTSELIQPIQQLLVQQIMFDCKTRCKTSRCACVHANKTKCNQLCHPVNTTCENK